MNPKVVGSRPSQVETDIFCLKNFDTFTRTSVRVSKTNAVARAQLAFQMLTLLQQGKSEGFDSCDWSCNLT